MHFLLILAELSAHTAGQAALWTIILICMSVASFLIIRKLRAEMKEDYTGSGQDLSYFRDMHASGELSDEEYYSIKRNLIEKVQDQIRSDEAEG